MAVFTNENKNSNTFTNSLRHGKEPKISDIADKTFTDTLYDGESKELKDYTFNELANQAWSNASKNSSTFVNENKS